MLNCLCSFLKPLKKTVGNKARVEGSICSAYLVQETSTFCSFYFDSHVVEQQSSMKRNAVNRTYDGVNPYDLSIFTFPGRTSGKAIRRQLTDEEYHLIQSYVLLNCPEVEPHIEYVHQ